MRRQWNEVAFGIIRRLWLAAVVATTWIVVLVTATATRTVDASLAKRPANAGLAELQKSLQLERDGTSKLEQDLAAPRRDVETQTAPAAKATDDARQAKQASHSNAAELRESLQQEQERAGRLEQELAAARRDVGAKTALAAKATDDASQAKQALHSNAAELRKSLQQEQERAGRLEQDLAAARRDVETQTTPAAMPPVAVAPPAPAAPPVTTPQARQIDADKLAVLMKRATGLLSAGDIPAARLLLQRAADAQEPTAALMLAQTYDPDVLGTQDVRNINPDLAMARTWYEKAAQLGSTDAQRRLAQIQN